MPTGLKYTDEEDRILVDLVAEKNYSTSLRPRCRAARLMDRLTLRMID